MNFDPTDDVFIRADKLGIRDVQVGIEDGVPYWKGTVDGVTNSMSWPARVNGQPFSALSHFSMFLDSYEEALKNRAAQNPLEQCVEWCAETFTSDVKEFLINGSRFELAERESRLYYEHDSCSRWYYLESNKELRLLFFESAQMAWVAFVGTCRCTAGHTPAEALRGALDHQRLTASSASSTADLLRKILCGES